MTLRREFCNKTKILRKEKSLNALKRILSGGSMMIRKLILYLLQRGRILISRVNKYLIAMGGEQISSYFYSKL